MKICILSQSAALVSTRRLIEEAEARGHEVEVIDPLRCYMNISSRKPEVHYKGRILNEFDAVIPRIGASITFYGAAVLRQFEMGGTYVLNSSVALLKSRDKLKSLQHMSKYDIGMPVSCFAHSTQATEDLIDSVGGAPLIIKVLEGTQGKGVVLAESKKAAESVIDMLRGLDVHFLVQQYIAESKGADVRCFVIKDKVVATMKRQGVDGEFRSNLHCGGVAEKTKISPDERATAIKAAKVMGLKVAGVDLIRSNNGPLVLEVNSSPGLEGIEKTTGKNVAGLIIEHIEKEVELKKAAGEKK
ncbi:30S ribosomal protein S6--L-glutamate ligase [Bacteriovorax sp. Seq25_V]|uniref:30S ribosomal protein S6--L-glutamate ligase n=1 Tax=Bacteriovorax sp. Seq25_V TaxID=1201288 RepID=UPI00038A16AC|nr:30S ribosomal protein S6--L-glutamate ligase [Bacteriovorax sp. Seq25_V]EQC43986.1 glutathione synthetase, ATP-binding domain protein [Bacteriovorax sp. Seq25_V]